MPKRNIIWLIAILLGAVALVWVTRNQPSLLRSDSDREFRSVQWAYGLVRDRYYRVLDDTELRRSAVEGIMQSLDEFSQYIPPESQDGLTRRVSEGLRRGLGLTLSSDPNSVGARVTDVQYFSPAYRGGLLVGDVVTAIDEQPTEGLSDDQLAERLDGETGTKAVLTVRANGGPAQDLPLTRSEYPTETVQGLCRDEEGNWLYLIDPERRVACVRIREFVADTPEQFQAVFRQIGTPSALVLDLRGNRGGSLEAATNFCDQFLSDGVIVSTVSRDEAPIPHHAHRIGTYARPIVVLIDEETASAAEVVCGALQHRGRAVLVGHRTRGKGCVQTLFPLGDGLGMIGLTTAEFFFGDEPTSITRVEGSEMWGIDPDITVDLSNPIRLARLQREAAMLRRPQMPAQNRTPVPSREMLQRLIDNDEPLQRAAELLRDPQAMRQYLADETTAGNATPSPSNE